MKEQLPVKNDWQVPELRNITSQKQIADLMSTIAS